MKKRTVYLFCLVAVLSVLGLLVAGSFELAIAGSRFKAKSKNLPASLSGNGCSELAGGSNFPGADFVPGRDVKGEKIAPAELPGEYQEIQPIVRFDLQSDRRLKVRKGANSRRRSPLRTNNLSLGEVSIDTSSGEVAVDGQQLTNTKKGSGC